MRAPAWQGHGRARAALARSANGKRTSSMCTARTRPRAGMSSASTASSPRSPSPSTAPRLRRQRLGAGDLRAETCRPYRLHRHRGLARSRLSRRARDDGAGEGAPLSQGPPWRRLRSQSGLTRGRQRPAPPSLLSAPGAGAASSSRGVALAALPAVPTAARLAGGLTAGAWKRSGPPFERVKRRGRDRAWPRSACAHNRSAAPRTRARSRLPRRCGRDG